ncbi:MAG TPA: caspase family protein [Kofleriaceae bacterium]|nr:caspase family protein [Kofleriaceae bacterium]
MKRPGSRFPAALAAGMAVLACARAAAADPGAPPALLPPPDTAAFALVVGSNTGGQAQAPLHYAESDARQVAELLGELGGYRPDRIQLALHPTRAQLHAALDALTARAVAEARAGRQPRVFFYFSGHARSSALNLASEEVPLTELRERLVGLAGGLTIVVLDACQSGAFSRIKGAEPTADFSFNSLARLSATGVAVLASSSASELSQESDRLGSSYFTHNLLVGLRGAGDASGDGKVSLDEAYRYAYHQTLLATAATRVGAQHVSLEVELKGKGEVPITTPAAADAQLELAAALEGEVLVERRSARAVVAELHKARGGAVRLGLPAAGYSVLVRAPGAAFLRRCDVELARGQVGRLALERCAREPLGEGEAKGAGGSGPRWSIELAIGGQSSIEDDFTRRLESFSYRAEEPLFPPPHLAASVVYHVNPFLGVVGQLSTLGRQRYDRDADGPPLEFSWSTLALGLHARGRLPLVGGVLTPFVQAGGGIATAFTELDDGAGAPDKQQYWGWHLGASAGLDVQPPRWLLGFTAEAAYVTAPVIDNLIGDTHDVGGRIVRFGVRASF